jgi:hypothetical protein
MIRAIALAAFAAAALLLALDAEVEGLQAENARLRESVMPFIPAIEALDSRALIQEEHRIWPGEVALPTVGELRAVRAALGGNDVSPVQRGIPAADHTPLGDAT